MALIAPLTPDDFRREATFGGERITLAGLVTLIEAHDNGHRQEIDRILDYIED